MFEYIEDPVLRDKAVNEFNASIDAVKVDMKTQIATEVDKATSGLKANHDKLLDEKKKLQERYKMITDPEEALAAIKMINENEDFKMLKEGKFEEVVQKRLSTVTQQHEEKIAELNTKLENNEMSATKYRSMYVDTVRDLRIKEAATSAGVLPAAMEDILNKGRSIFNLADDEKSVEARDNQGKLKKTVDEKILTVDLWIEGLKKTSPHYWPGSKSGGLVSGGDSDDINAQIADAAKRGDNAEYKRLRKIQREQKGMK